MRQATQAGGAQGTGGLDEYNPFAEGNQTTAQVGIQLLGQDSLESANLCPQTPGHVLPVKLCFLRWERCGG